MKEILAAIDVTNSAQLLVVLGMLVVGLAILAGQGILWLLGE